MSGAEKEMEDFVLGHRKIMENNYVANPQLVEKVLLNPNVQAKKKVLERAATTIDWSLKCMKKPQSK